MPEQTGSNGSGNGHRSETDIAREIEERRLHLGERIDQLEHLAREKLDVRARARVAWAKSKQEVKVHPWPAVGMALALGLLFGIAFGRSFSD
jgi:ElaB/YqjD/DUF883 family membrane-anchored ribosome-binding protein